MRLRERIAVFLPNWVGDAVMATPALRCLRGHFRDDRIIFVGKPAVLETLAGAGLNDQTITDLSASGPRLANFLRAAKELRQARVSLALLLPNSFRSAVLARCGGARQVAGYSRDGRGWLLTQRLSPPRDDRGRFRPVSMIDYYNDLVRLLGVEASSRTMGLAVTADGEARAEEILARAGRDPLRPLVMLNPGAAFGPSKMWEPDRYAAAADALIERCGAQIVVNCAPAERRIGAVAAGLMRRPPLIDLAREQNSITLLKSLLRRCRLLITNDTGARHVAAAFGVGLVTIFGSTDPRWSEIHYDRERICRVEVRCSPCQSKLCLQPAGPMYQQCTSAVTVEMVLAAAEELLHAPAWAAAAGAAARSAVTAEARP